MKVEVKFAVQSLTVRTVSVDVKQHGTGIRAAGKRGVVVKFQGNDYQNQNQNIYCPSTSLQGNLSYGAQ